MQTQNELFERIEQSGVKVKTLATHLGVSIQTIYNWKAGQDMKMKHVLKIHDFLTDIGQ